MSTKKTVLVTGSSGQLSTEYQLSNNLKEFNFVFLDKKSLDIVDFIKTQKTFDEIEPDIVLNLAAYTDVELAETRKKEESYKVNAIGPKNLAVICHRNNVPLIHISTDYVFDGRSREPYIETDIPNPVNRYGADKLAGERGIIESCDWYYIIRTSWLYSNHGKNFYTKMLDLAQERSEFNVVNDQFGSPTSTKELCRALDKILINTDDSLSGIYHFSGLGRTDWKSFTETIFMQTGISALVNPVPTSSYKTMAIRPIDSYLSSEKFISTFNYIPMHWKNALKEIVDERKTLPIKVGDVIVSEGKKFIVVATDWSKKLARVSNVDNLQLSTDVPFDILQLHKKQ